MTLMGLYFEIDFAFSKGNLNHMKLHSPRRNSLFVIGATTIKTIFIFANWSWVNSLQGFNFAQMAKICKTHENLSHLGNPI